MAVGAISSARDPRSEERWKWLLLSLCAVAFTLVLFAIADIFGLGGRPWFGDWDAVEQPAQQSFVLIFRQPVRAGASDRAGIRDGDTLDLREQNFASRVGAVYFPSAVRPDAITIHRGQRRLSLRILADSIWEGQSALKLGYQVTAAITNLWFLGCALLVALRASGTRVGRIWALILLLWAIPTQIITPNPGVTLFFGWVSRVGYTVALALFVYLTSLFGERHRWRRVLEWCAYGLVVIAGIQQLVWPIGVITLQFDPLPYTQGILWGYLDSAAFVIVFVTAVAAVVSTPRSSRSRSAWLLLPFSLSNCIGILIANEANTNVMSWPILEMWTLVGGVVSVVGVAAVTYALLQRRVLDVGFVLSRALVVSIVGLVVVIAFVLLEWVLGSVLAGVSHATGLIANAALALLIGVSLSYIHKRVDQSVDLVLFRKRHKDERALLAFSKEAAYVTEWDVLLDATLEKIRHHTDARSAALLIGANGFYTAVRSFGDGSAISVNENDEAILALKTWHKPIDPHHYDTVLQAALVVPMLARGKLYGVQLLGERAGGEAYAPDEVEALSQLGNGVGSALDSLAHLDTRDRDNAIIDELRALRSVVEQALTPGRP